MLAGLEFEVVSMKAPKIWFYNLPRPFNELYYLAKRILTIFLHTMIPC